MALVVLFKNGSQYSESCVTNNGYMASYFKLSEGIRQGCLISVLLFLLIIEIIAIIFRQSDNIKCVHINGIDIRLCQLADDMTLFLNETEAVSFSMQLLIFKFFFFIWGFMSLSTLYRSYHDG